MESGLRSPSLRQRELMHSGFYNSVAQITSRLAQMVTDAIMLFKDTATSQSILSNKARATHVE